MIAVTGANGFVGRALCARLASEGLAYRPLLRRASAPGDWAVGDIGPDTDWSSAMKGVRCVVHCAARVHLLQDSAASPLEAYRAVNVQGSRRLAEQAAAAGVKRLVFLSSIKVNGEHTVPGQAFAASDTPAPQDAYGQSKWEAEMALTEVARDTGLELVVVRPPLVYGPGVRANFLRLMNWVARGVPLPLAQVNNRRSLVALDNLVDLLLLCTHHPKASGQTWMVSDGHDLSTPDLVRAIGHAMGRPARLFGVPPSLLRLGGQLSGRGAEIDRLLGSLQVNAVPTLRALDWRPPLSVEQGLRRAVMDYAP
ncbi:MAG: SDR family oxidoreductase [Pseudomonas sp.]|nr:SDR family oxidoreductase [Pseudomonas sp.]